MSRTPRAKTKTTTAGRQQDADTATAPAPDPGVACPIPRPADPDADLTQDEEEAYSLLVDIAAADEEASRDRRAERRQGRDPPKSRVEFSRLAVRARAIRHALDYFSGVPPSKSLRALGLSWGDVQICRFASRDYERVYQLVRYRAGERLADKAIETAERALDGAKVDGPAVQLSRWVLERLGDARYKDPRYTYMRGAQAGPGGGGVAYQINIINTAAPVAGPAIQAQIGQTSAPRAARLCGACVDMDTATVDNSQKGGL